MQNALVLHPYLKHRAHGLRTPDSILAEAVGLAEAIDLHVAAALTVPLSTIRPASVLGTGKMEEIKEIIAAHDITVAIIDHKLSPVQQKNLEKAWNCKVIDRTALILEIFGARARTAEGKLQVELASLEYQKGRLVRSWTHLERQRGGFGFLGGPGETQIETDRRLIRDRIALIKSELETVVRTRGLHRKLRHEAPYPVVALVGYTNAGKSTLFNRLTRAEVLAEDMLFATLDPTLRKVILPGGMEIMLSDTVGFISQLPHELVAAFRATLEEVKGAALILHVRDLSHPDAAAQKADVETVLSELFGDDETWRGRMLEVGNKMDLITETEAADTYHEPRATLPISALTGDGIPALLSRMVEFLSTRMQRRVTCHVPASDGRAQAWLHRYGQVVSVTHGDDETEITLRLSPRDMQRFTQEWPDYILHETA